MDKRLQVLEIALEESFEAKRRVHDRYHAVVTKALIGKRALEKEETRELISLTREYKKEDLLYYRIKRRIGEVEYIIKEEKRLNET